MTGLKKAVAYQKIQAEHIKNNAEQIKTNNRKMLKFMLTIGCFSYGIIFILSFFLESYRELAPLYGIIFCFVALFILCLKYFFKNADPVLLIYTGYGVMVAYSIYSSAFVTPDDICVTILFLLFELPVIIIDKSWRVNIIEGVYLLLYLILAVPFKNEGLVVDEVLNSVLFTGVAVILGEYMRNIKIDNFELNRQMAIREKFDYLTGLGNRRNLFERLEKMTNLKDMAVIMLDVDNFKLYNDTYGHQKDDECLRELCLSLRDFGEHHGIVFTDTAERNLSVLSMTALFQSCQGCAGRSIVPYIV